MAHGANQAGPTISTHVLDTERGVPAVGVPVTLYRLSEDGRPLRLTQALTDADGRVHDLLERPLVTGEYRLEFDLTAQADPVVGAAAASAASAAVGSNGVASVGVDGERFFARVSLDLRIADPARSYHVPLLLAPFSITTYRGS